MDCSSKPCKTDIPKGHVLTGLHLQRSISRAGRSGQGGLRKGLRGEDLGEFFNAAERLEIVMRVPPEVVCALEDTPFPELTFGQLSIPRSLT